LLDDRPGLKIRQNPEILKDLLLLPGLQNLKNDILLKSLYQTELIALTTGFPLDFSNSAQGHKPGKFGKSTSKLQKFPPKVLVIGGDGYRGWVTALHLKSRPPSLHIRQPCSSALGQRELARFRPDPDRINIQQRIQRRKDLTGKAIDLLALSAIFATTVLFCSNRLHSSPTPLSILANRSAPFSMIDREHAVSSIQSNVM
jgi:UDP-sulfoquinovose synthase